MRYAETSDRLPDGLRRRTRPTRVKTSNALVQQVARSHPGVGTMIHLNRMVSPAYTATLSGVHGWFADCIHFGVGGGDLLQRQILPAVDQVGMENEAAEATW